MSSIHSVWAFKLLQSANKQYICDLELENLKEAEEHGQTLTVRHGEIPQEVALLLESFPMILT